MGRYLQPGHTYSDGQTITGPSLTEHVADAVLKTTAISEQLLKDNAAATDELLINDSDVFKKITLQILKVFVGGELTIDDLSDELRSQLRTPIGAILDFAGENAPEGWLLCYGQAVSRETYDLLFAAIGTAWGEGDSSVTFNVPDLRGYITAGKDNMGGTAAGVLDTYITGTTLGAAGGAEAIGLSWHQNGAHYHNVSGSGSASVTGEVIRNGYGSLRGDGGSFGQVNTTFSGSSSISGLTDTQGQGQGHNNIQPTRIVNKIIRAL